MTRSRRQGFWLLSLLALFAGGCNLLGVVAYKTMPPPKRPAAHELAEVPTAVRVTADPAVSGERGPLDAEVVASAAERALARQARAAIVDATAARQTIEVFLEPPRAEAVLGSDVSSASVAARVRVLDAAGVEIWPADGSAGQYVEAQAPAGRTRDPQAFRRALLRGLGEQVAQLFYPQVIEE